MGKKIGGNPLDAGSITGRFEFTKLQWWIPTFKELALFILAIFLTYWVIQIYQYNNVETKIVKESRCYRDKHAVKAGGTEYVTATNAQNLPLYRVGYNLSGKQMTLECACNQGDIVNTFKNIPVYNLSNNSISRGNEKQCNCDSDLLSESQNIYFTGYPGIVKFMNTAAGSSSNDLTNDPSIDTTYFLPTKKN